MGGLVTTIALAIALITGCGASTDTDTSMVNQPLSLADSPSSASSATSQPAAPQLEPSEDAQAIDTTVAVAPLSASTPVRIEIPAIGVDSDLIGLGLQADGTMEVPSGGFPGGWYNGSPTPGEMGPSIVAGHVDWGGDPGIFYRLRELNSGDSVIVSRQDDSVLTFTVSDIEQYPKAEFPTASVYGDIDYAGLRLITCGGAFDSDAASYDDNIVVYAALT
ncbi:class F sortase [Rhodococcus sp. H29-C3]|uniref:class F sortase n=1 Tax=Rhodococcus sp. H29-C3 TaxID=3046307 RepID=UPI0024BB6EA1|nr:class F sortase [Rhodococcus sp. H29-C3]MDJ0362558.1 class F sortase [Rhodococcus sp. H29-C3]